MSKTPTPAELRDWDCRHYWHAFTQMAEYEPLVIERAEGCRLFDIDGRAYLDGVSSMWCNVHGHRHPRIDAAIREVLRGPMRYDTLYVSGSTLTTEATVGAEPVYLGRDASGAPTGYAIVAAAPGFADVIGVIFGYDPATRTVLGMKVLESKETPGLGDRIEKDTAWVAQFVGALSPLEGVKSGRGTGKPAEIDLITGATISSRTVVRIINDALDRLGPALGSGRAVAP